MSELDEGEVQPMADDLSPWDLSHALGFRTRYTVYRWIREGCITYYRVPGSNRIRIPYSELERIRNNTY